MIKVIIITGVCVVGVGSVHAVAAGIWGRGGAQQGQGMLCIVWVCYCCLWLCISSCRVCIYVWTTCRVKHTNMWCWQYILCLWYTNINLIIHLQKRMENSTETLKNLISSLEEEADPITALALFPLKSTDKKIAFVVGLVCICCVYRSVCLLCH